MKATVSGVVEDLKFKISEGSDQNWCLPDSAQLAVSNKKFLKNPESAIIKEVHVHAVTEVSTPCKWT